MHTGLPGCAATKANDAHADKLILQVPYACHGAQRLNLLTKVTLATFLTCMHSVVHMPCPVPPCPVRKEKEKTTLLSVIKEKLMVNLSFPLA